MRYVHVCTCMCSCVHYSFTCACAGCSNFHVYTCTCTCTCICVCQYLPDSVMFFFLVNECLMLSSCLYIFCLFSCCQLNHGMDVSAMSNVLSRLKNVSELDLSNTGKYITTLAHTLRCTCTCT